MNWESIAPIAEKLGIIAVVVFLAYVVVRGVVWFLTDMVVGSPKEQQPSNGGAPESQGPSGDPTSDLPGLHVLSDYGSGYEYVGENPSEETIRRTIRKLDWHDGLHQVVLVTSPGISLEVGGSLNPEDGLASVYRDLKNEVHRVTREPPTTVENMEDLLISFHRGDGRWQQMYDYD